MNKIERKTIRLKNWDYSSNGRYFVSFCVKDKMEYFGRVWREKIILNLYGAIVYQQILWLRKQYQYIKIEHFVIMPNHIHLIIEIINNKNICSSRDESRLVPTDMNTTNRKALNKIKPLSQLIGALKTTTSKIIHIFGGLDFLWQHNYFEKIIRDQRELKNIQMYIQNNPSNWKQDENNLNRFQ